MGARWRRWLAVGLIVVVAVAAVPGAVAAADVVGTVLRIQGDARVSRDGAEHALVVDAQVLSGDVLITGADSKLRVRMIDDSVLTLGAESVFAIDDYVYDEDHNSGSALLEMRAGVFRMITGVIAISSPDSFAVKTPIGTIGVRGTDFWGGEVDGVFTVVLLGGTGVFVQNVGGRVALSRAGSATSLRVAAADPTERRRVEDLALAPGDVRRGKFLAPTPPRQLSKRQWREIIQSVSFQ